jgi:hypothetical protein
MNTTNKIKIHACSLVFASIFAPLCLLASGAGEASGAKSSSPASVDNPDPFHFQGSLLDPLIRKQLDRIIKIGKMKEVRFKDYPRRDNWDVEILPPQNEEKLAVTPEGADLKRGFIPYSRPVTDLVFPYSRPRERKERFEIAAVRGQYEPFTLCLYNVGGEQNFSVSLSRFKSTESGETLAPENTQVRTTSFLPLIRMEQNIYINLPMALEKKESLMIPAEETGQFWITTHVPRQAKPGKYEATLKVTSGNGTVSEFPVLLTVLPFDLDEPTANLSMCFLIQNYPEMHPQNLDLYMADMKSHGLNTAWMWPMGEIEITDKKLSVDFSKRSTTSYEGLNYFAHSAEEMMAAYGKAGFKRNWIYGSMDSLMHLLEGKGLAKVEDPASSLPYMEQYTGELIKFAKEKNLPSFTLLLKDEPGFQPERLPSMKKLYEGMHKAFPDQPLMLDCGPWAGEDKLLAPYVRDIYFTSPTREKEKFCRDAKILFGNYNSGSGGKNPLIDRFCYGVWPVKAGLEAVSNWVYTWKMDPKGPDGNCYVFPAADGPIPSLAWEGVRQGVDDQRYLLTFRRLAKEAVSSGDEGKKARANAMLSDVESFMVAVPPDRSDRRNFLKSLSQDRLDRFRATLISNILELLGKGGADRAASAVRSPNVHRGVLRFGPSENQGLEKSAAGVGKSPSFCYSLGIKYALIPDDGAYFGGMGRDWFARLSPEGRVEFGFLNGTACVLESSVKLVPSRWYHVELSVMGKVAAIKIDGTVVATAAIPPRDWNLSRSIRLSGYPWEPPDQKGYFGNHGFFCGELRDISLNEA